MEADEDPKELLERTPQPFTSPDPDTWTAAWAVSQRGKAQRKTDADDRTEAPAEDPTETPVPDSASGKAARKIETSPFGPVRDTFTVACDERLRLVPTGRRVESTVTAVWTLSGGVVTRYRESYATAALAAALRAD